MRRIIALVATLCLLLGASPGQAEAATNVAVRGQVTCINSYVVGVWVQAESSKSGWASWKVPISLGGHSKADYNFTLNKGGRYQVHVGCGGTAKDWKVNAKSGYVGGAKNNFVCNDIHPALNWFKRLTPLRKLDLTQGVAYKTCSKR